MRNLPTITKNLLLLNIFVWFVDILMQRYGIRLYDYLGLHYVTSSSFHIWQPLTYMFMHGGFSHLFFNMFAVLMFAPVLEQEWGGKRFLFYYLLCGLGAAFVQELVWGLKVESLLSTYSAESVMMNYVNQVVTVGASGAVFGILLAFGWFFPDVPMFIIFLPIPIKARYFVLLYAAVELLAGFSNLPGDNVAHFAHLGGMLFGLVVLLWWRYGERWLHDVRWPWQKHERLDSSRAKDYSGYHYHHREN